MRCRIILESVLLCVAVAAPVVAVIPSDECVLLERRSRIAKRRGDKAGSLALLEEASGVCREKVALLLELEHIYRWKDGSTEQLAAVHKRLVRNVEQKDAPVSMALLDRFVSDSRTTDDDLEFLLHTTQTWLARDPESPRLLEALATIYARRSETASAREVLDRLIAIDDKPIYRRNAYYLDLALEHWDPALDYVLKRVAAGHNDILTRIGLIRLLAKTGRYAELLELTQPLLGTPAAGVGLPGGYDELAATVLIPAAWSLYDAAKVEEAETYFRLLLEKSPNNVELQQTVLHLFAGEEEQAERREQIERRWAGEQNPLKLLKEGSARLGAGDAAGAYELIRRATTIDPHSEVGWFNLGLAASKLEHWQEAEDALSRLIELAPSMTDAYYNRGIARVQLARHAEALADLKYYVAERPDQKGAWYYIYSCYKALGKMKLAGEALQRYK